MQTFLYVLSKFINEYLFIGHVGELSASIDVKKVISVSPYGFFNYEKLLLATI